MKHRLSKLQKWILLKCLETRNREINYPNGLLFRREITRQYFNNYTKVSQVAEASVSRSLRGLINKGLLLGYTPRFIERNVKDIMAFKSLDIATIMAMDYKEQGKTIEDYERDYGEILKTHKKADKLLMPARYKKETLSVVSLSPLGLKAVLKLSNVNILKLNNKKL